MKPEPDDSFDPDEALYNAVRIRSVRGVRKLLRNGADIDHTDWDGSTALHVDAGFKGLEITKVLIDAGVMINSKDTDGKTALGIALSNGDKEKARFLIAHGARDSNMSETLTVEQQGAFVERKTQEVLADFLENAVIPVKERPVVGSHEGE